MMAHTLGWIFGLHLNPVMAIANGVVTKVVNTEGAVGKYVIIRHDLVSFDGRASDSYYSSYLHLENATAIEGNVIKKVRYSKK